MEEQRLEALRQRLEEEISSLPEGSMTLFAS